MKTLVVIALCLVTWAHAQRARGQKQGPCFEFDGRAYLEFEPDNLNITTAAHYTLNFQTTQENGILLYAKGSHDYEALYIHNGILTYDLVNPNPSGVGRSRGAHLESSHRVNNNTLLSVELFRNRRVRRGPALMPGERAPFQTGMVLREVRGTTHEEEILHNRGRLAGVQILSPVYIGGFGHEQSPIIGQFIGQISDIREKRNGRTFVDPSRNIGVTRCLVGRLPA